MGRLYAVTSGFVTVTTAGGDNDLLDLEAGANDPFILHYLGLSQSTEFGDAAAEQLQLRVIRASSGYTNSSAGAGATVEPYRNLSDTADSLAVHTCNNTTIASVGTFATIWEEVMNIQAGWQFLPPPEMRPYFNSGEGMILRLVEAVDDDITASVMAIVEELG